MILRIIGIDQEVLNMDITPFCTLDMYRNLINPVNCMTQSMTQVLSMRSHYVSYRWTSSEDPLWLVP